MPIDIAALQNQLPEAVRIMANRRQSLPNLPDLQDQLHLAAQQPDLRQKIQAAGDRWSGAYPTDEPIDSTYPLPAVPAPYTVLAVDGSQIFPDKHEAHIYYLLNIVGCIMRMGSGQPVSVARQTHLFADDNDLLMGGFLVSSELVNKRRAVRELQHIVDLVEKESTSDPIIALVDGRLAIVQSDQEIKEEKSEHARLLREHLTGLGNLATSQVILGGYVDRPGGTPILSTLYLASFPIKEIPQALQNTPSPFPWTSDRVLFQHILTEPGQRSAVFEFVTGWNQQYRNHAESHSIHAFYLNVGRGMIARVECPRWVATDRVALDRLHGVVYQQCQYVSETPYPYVLALADGEAVVQANDRAVVDDMLTREMLRQGHPIPRISTKLQLKQWTRPPHRR